MGNTTSNAILEHIHQVMGNLVQTYTITQTYIDKDDPWSGIMTAAEFTMISTTNRLKGYSLGQLVFGRDVILLIKHKLDGIFLQNKTLLCYSLKLYSLRLLFQGVYHFPVSRPIPDFYSKIPVLYAMIPCYLGSYVRYCARCAMGVGPSGVMEAYLAL